MDCGAYCSHGGICILSKGHEGKHDTDYCQWDDEESITRQEADAILATKPGGDTLLLMESLFRNEPEQY